MRSLFLSAFFLCKETVSCFFLSLFGDEGLSVASGETPGSCLGCIVVHLASELGRLSFGDGSPEMGVRSWEFGVGEQGFISG